ncbi:hypothetical protein ACLB2K_043866 [Fragaria x ananassa]
MAVIAANPLPTNTTAMSPSTNSNTSVESKTKDIGSISKSKKKLESSLKAHKAHLDPRPIPYSRLKTRSQTRETLVNPAKPIQAQFLEDCCSSRHHSSADVTITRDEQRHHSGIAPQPPTTSGNAD